MLRDFGAFGSEDMNRLGFESITGFCEHCDETKGSIKAGISS
jgi:hypothetical protein